MSTSKLAITIISNQNVYLNITLQISTSKWRLNMHLKGQITIGHALIKNPKLQSIGFSNISKSLMFLLANFIILNSGGSSYLYYY